MLKWIEISKKKPTIGQSGCSYYHCFQRSASDCSSLGSEMYATDLLEMREQEYRTRILKEAEKPGLRCLTRGVLSEAK